MTHTDRAIHLCRSRREFRHKSVQKEHKCENKENAGHLWRCFVDIYNKFLKRFAHQLQAAHEAVMDGRPTTVNQPQRGWKYYCLVIENTIATHYHT